MSTNKFTHRDNVQIEQLSNRTKVSRLGCDSWLASLKGLTKRESHQFFLATLLALIVFTAPALASDVSTTTASLSPQQTSDLIQRLNSAKKADWDAALDPSVSPVREETFLNQMNKADRVSKELSHGFSVPQSKIDDALWAPPKHISPEERAHLIRQLEAARQQDDQNEQTMLNDLAWSRSAAPADTVIFDERKQEVDAVVKNLEIGAPVHWTAIKEAMVVPAIP
jgi:hypothetical protein